MRTYPKFIYSDPQNVKNAGPFIIHLLPPFVVFKVEITGKSIDLKILNDAFNNIDLPEVKKAALKWIHFNKEFTDKYM